MFPLLILLFGFSFVTSSDKFYRNDYTYVEEFDSFYKLHLNNREINWSSAFQACEEEGAELFYPKGTKEWNVPRQLWGALRYTPITSEIFVGLRDEFEECGFRVMKVSTTFYPKWSMDTNGEGRCVTLDIYTGNLVANECTEDTIRHFVCKKTSSVYSCPTDGYEYSKETGKCHKFHTKPKTWCKAMETCLAEGGSLLMIENLDEAKFFTRKNLHDRSHYIGVKRRLSDQIYYTVTGHQPSTTGLVNELNGSATSECGTIWKYNQIHLDSAPCTTIFPFICEIKGSE